MKISLKIIIVSAITLGATVLFLFNVTNTSNNMTYADNYNSTTQFSNSILFNDLNSKDLSIMDPISYQDSFEYENKKLASFVLYEDFPLKMQSPVFNLKLINMPDDVWTKLIPDETIHPDHTYGMTLRMMGAIKPFVPTPFNDTIFVIGPKDKNGIPPMASTAIVQNRIMTEISIVGDSLPIKFKNPIFAKKNSTSFYIFGIVYDKDITSNPSIFEINPSSLDVNIEPVGIMSNGILIKFPEWLKVQTIKLPLSLKQNQPSYYALMVSTSGAPLGTYEITLHETINKKIFVQTITLLITDAR